MELNPGMLVYVSHYSGRQPMVSSIVGIKQDKIRVYYSEKLSKSFVHLDDPIAVNFKQDKKIYTCEGYITDIDSVEKTIELQIKNRQEIADNRVFERFPVSLYAMIKLDGGKKHVAIVKNISLSGFAISTKAFLKSFQVYDFEIYVDERVISLKGEVAWKNKEEKRAEYGLKSIYPDYIVKNTVRLYIEILKDEQKNFTIKGNTEEEMLTKN